MRDGPRSARRSESIACVKIRRGVVLVLILALLPGPVLAQAAGSIRGVVRDSLGGVVSDAHVAIQGSAARTTSASSGAFRLAGLPPGEAVLEVRRLGYRPFSSPVNVAAGRELQIDVSLSSVPEQLAPVQITRRAEAYDSRLAGFNARKSKHVGHIVTREKLDQMSSARFVDALRGMPGVSVRTLRGGVVTVSLRGARCAPLFYMDGFPATSGVMDLDMIDLSGIEGIEVYAGMSSIPAEFLISAGGEKCGVIAVWSRPFRPKPPAPASAPAAELERLIAAHTVYTAEQVQAPAALISSEAGPPVYPDSLLAAGISGRVVAEFIVRQDGSIEPGTLTIVSATHTHFASAVRLSLDGAVFVPGVLDGKPVRQLVQLPFHFKPPNQDQDGTAVSR